MTTKTFALPADMDAKLVELKANGIGVSDQTPTSGTLTHDSYRFAYSTVSGALALTLVHKPMLVPEGAVWSHIEQYLGAAQ